MALQRQKHTRLHRANPLRISRETLDSKRPRHRLTLIRRTRHRQRQTMANQDGRTTGNKTMKHIKNGKIDMQEAAQRTNIKGGLIGLYKLLKAQQLFNSDNTPKRHLVQQGLFILEPKRARIEGRPDREYIKTWATLNGLLWLHEIVEKHGTKKTNPKNEAA